MCRVIGHVPSKTYITTGIRQVGGKSLRELTILLSTEYPQYPDVDLLKKKYSRPPCVLREAKINVSLTWSLTGEYVDLSFACICICHPTKRVIPPPVLFSRCPPVVRVLIGGLNSASSDDARSYPRSILPPK